MINNRRLIICTLGKITSGSDETRTIRTSFNILKGLCRDLMNKEHSTTLYNDPIGKLGERNSHSSLRV